MKNMKLRKDTLCLLVVLPAAAMLLIVAVGAVFDFALLRAIGCVGLVIVLYTLAACT